METIELKMKLDMAFEYLLPLIIIVIVIIASFIKYLVEKIKERKRRKCK